jgi:endogenous inhibitor of DNA gyrase (YacG/DUF329 family)
MRPMLLKCPICGKTATWEENDFRPFCSERCKMIDLGKWAAERYRIPGKEESKSEGTGEPENGESRERQEN